MMGCCCWWGAAETGPSPDEEEEKRSGGLPLPPLPLLPKAAVVFAAAVAESPAALPLPLSRAAIAAAIAPPLPNERNVWACGAGLAPSEPLGLAYRDPTAELGYDRHGT